MVKDGAENTYGLNLGVISEHLEDKGQTYIICSLRTYPPTRQETIENLI